MFSSQFAPGGRRSTRDSKKKKGKKGAERWKDAFGRGDMWPSGLSCTGRHEESHQRWRRREFYTRRAGRPAWR